MAEKKATSVAEDAMGDMGAAAPLDTDTTSMAATEAYESDINYALMVAVTYRSAQMVEMLLEAGAKATYFSSWYPILLTAIDVNATEVVKVLLQHGAEVQVSRSDSTGLHVAAMKGNMDILKLLFNAGLTNMNVVDEHHKQTPMHVAASWKRLDCIEFLKQNGANVNAKDGRGQTPLHLAAKCGAPTIVEWLLNNGANPREINNEYNLPWMVALNENQSDVVKLLLNHQGLTPLDEANEVHPLLLACLSGHLKVIQFLMDEGVNCNIKDSDGNTPLLCAARKGHFNIVQYLLVHFTNDVDVNASCQQGHSVLYHILQNCTCQSVEDVEAVFKLVLAAGANVNMCNLEGHSLLMINITNEKWTYVDWLINGGADLNTVSHDGSTALTCAVNYLLNTGYDGREDTIVHKLLKANIDMRISSEGPEGVTPLHLAIKKQNTHLVKLLVNAGSSLKNIASWLKSEDAKDYSSDLDLCETFLWLKNIVCQPLSLQQMCRKSVLGTLGHINISDKITQLPLPNTIKTFLCPIAYLKMNAVDNN